MRFCALRRNSRWPPKVAGKQFLGKVASRLWRYPAGQEFVKITLSRSISEINAFFALYAEIQDGRQKWRENNFGEKSPVDSADAVWVKTFVESRSVSKTNIFLHLTQKFKMAAKSGGKTIFGKLCQQTLQIPCGSKILSKSLYLIPFSR